MILLLLLAGLLHCFTCSPLVFLHTEGQSEKVISHGNAINLTTCLDCVKLMWSNDYKIMYLLTLETSKGIDAIVNVSVNGFLSKHRKSFAVNLQCRSNKTEMVTLSATTWRVAAGVKLVPSADPQTTNISIFIDCSTCLQSKESMDERPSCSLMCANGSYCQRKGGREGRDVCVCRRGYMGRHCELPQCPLRCLNGGVCFKPYTCICQLGYEGSQCQHSSNDCLPNCQNGGTCNSGVCECPRGLTGDTCGEKSIEFLEYPNNLKVRVREAAVFTCMARGFPQPDILWYRSGEVVDTSQDERFRIITSRERNETGSLLSNSTREIVTSSLYIYGTKSTDFGYYSCSINSTVGTKIHSAYLVVFPADTTMKDQQDSHRNITNYWDYRNYFD